MHGLDYATPARHQPEPAIEAERLDGYRKGWYRSHMLGKASIYKSVPPVPTCIHIAWALVRGC